METYVAPKNMMDNPQFQVQKNQMLKCLSPGMIEQPLTALVSHFNALPYCFTLQCCYGHFLYTGQMNPDNLAPLPDTDSIDRVEYRIAYLAFCVDNTSSGKAFLERLQKTTAIDPQNIQFGCADWFWKQQVNSFVLQVEPERYRDQDKVTLDYKEALILEQVREEFFATLRTAIAADPYLPL